MALSCQLSLSYRAYTAGQTPPPAASLFIYNPNAVAVTVTGLEMVYTDAQGNPQQPVVNASVPPLGPGQPTTIAALGTTTLGPFPICVGSVGAESSFQMVPPGSLPSNPQRANRGLTNLMVAMRVYGSDGSVNLSGADRLFVSYTVAPPLGYQGGFAQFAAPNNVILVAAMVG